MLKKIIIGMVLIGSVALAKAQTEKGYKILQFQFKSVGITEQQIKNDMKSTAVIYPDESFLIITESNNGNYTMVSAFYKDGSFNNSTDAGQAKTQDVIDYLKISNSNLKIVKLNY